MEYLNWVEDLNTTPILGVWSGLSTGNYSDQGNWASVAQQDLQPYVDDVVNEIEFITGDPSTNKWAALRKQLGREKPYALTYIEV
jgi:alpha-N-arabinofuranosidase